MATTGTNIITERVRDSLNDTSTQTNVQRWSDTLLLRLLNDAETMIVSLRPDALLAADGSVLTITPLTGIGQNINLGDKWALAIHRYICQMALSMPGKGRLNINASNHFKGLFEGLIKSL